VTDGHRAAAGEVVPPLQAAAPDGPPAPRVAGASYMESLNERLVFLLRKRGRRRHGVGRRRPPAASVRAVRVSVLPGLLGSALASDERDPARRDALLAWFVREVWRALAQYDEKARRQHVTESS